MDEHLIFDIETDGLQATKVHCLVIMDLDGNVTRYREHDESLKQGVERLKQADLLIGHNIIGYDLPTLRRLFRCNFRGDIYDTFVTASFHFVGRMQADFTNPHMPPALANRHSLEAWGHRLRLLKGDYGKQSDAWDRWTPEMEDYCEQDVRVTAALYEHLKRANVVEAARELEQSFYSIMQMQQEYGFYFDRREAEKLMVRLEAQAEGLEVELRSTFRPQEVVKQLVRVPKPQLYDEVTEVDTEEGRRFKCVKRIPFNPSSRQQIAERLLELGWKPSDFTPTGQPQVDESTLSEFAPQDERVKLLLDYLLVRKRLAQLSDGASGWLKLVGDDDRIHGRVISAGGTVSHRCAHVHPNVAQVPRVSSPYGKECRSLFRADEGRLLVGCDVSGLELRILSHYLARWDKGAYRDQVLSGDIHTYNQHRAGLPTRDAAKTFIYAFVYGAGDEKLGSLVGGGKREGKRMRQRFLNEIVGLRELVEGVKAAATKRKCLRAIDGRMLYPRSSHSALNLLIQSAGAICVKMATVLLVNDLHDRGLTPGLDYGFVAHVHDEWQIETWPDFAELIEEVSLSAIVRAGLHFGLRCPLDGEAKTGHTWADTH